MSVECSRSSIDDAEAAGHSVSAGKDGPKRFFVILIGPVELTDNRRDRKPSGICKFCVEEAGESFGLIT